MRIEKFLARQGVCSRREALPHIQAGHVKVNGQVIQTPLIFLSTGDVVTIAGQTYAFHSSSPLPELWMYHKPRGEIVSNRDPYHKKTVFDQAPFRPRRFMVVGRLDLNTEGLLLFSNNADLVTQYMTSSWERRYRVRIFGPPIGANTFDRITQGVTLKGCVYQPCRVQYVPSTHYGNTWVTITLTEGKNKEIHKLMNSLGYTVSRLIRISFGPYTLDTLPVGQWTSCKISTLK